MKKQIDAFDRAKRDFRIVGIILLLWLLFLIFFAAASGAFTDPTANYTYYIALQALYILTLFVTSYLFKKHTKAAIYLGYITIIGALALNAPEMIKAGAKESIVGLIVPLILLSDVIRAHRQLKTQLPVPTPPTQQI